MKLRRQWFRPGRRIEAIRNMGAHPFFSRPARPAAASRTVGVAVPPHGPALLPSHSPPRRLLLPALAENIGALFSILISLVLIGAILALLYAFVRELRRETLEIERVSAPVALTARGYSEPVIAGAMLDEFRTIQSSASTIRARRQLESDSAIPDIQVAGAGLSMKSIVRYARRLLGLPDNRIDGEILQRDTALRMVLHVYEGTTSQTTAVERADGDVDALLRDGGRALAQIADPYVLASYLHDKEKAAGQFTETLAAIDYVLAHPPVNDDGWALNLLGIVRGEQHRTDESLDAFRRAIAADPHLQVVGANYAGALAAAGRDDDLAAYLKQRQAAATTIDDWTQLLGMYFNVSDYPGILEPRRRLLDLDPRNVAALQFGTIALYYLHRGDEALAWAQRATDLVPGNVPLRINLSAALANNGQGEKGLAIAQAVLDEATAANSPNDIAGAYWLRGFAKAYMGRHEEALADFAKSSELGNNDAVLNEMAGKSLLALHRPAEAIARFQLAIAVNRNSWMGYAGWGDAELAQGHFEEAIRQYTRAERGDKNNVAMYLAWADALDQLGRGKEADAKRTQAHAAEARLKIPVAS